MGAIAGLLTLAAGASTNELVSEFQQQILVRNSRGIGNGATLFGLMSRLKNENAENSEYKWFERDPVTRKVLAAAAAPAVSSVPATTVLVDDGAAGNVTGLVQVGTILRAGNGELLQVTAVAAFSSGSISLTVVRALGTVGGVAPTAADIADNDVFTILTLGKEEGSVAVRGVFETATTLTNYIQTFNAAVELTNAFKATVLRTDLEGPLKERRVQALERITRDIELAYMFGRASRSTGAGGGYVYTTGGIVDSVDQIGTTVPQRLNGLTTTGVTLAVFNDWLASILTLGSENKIAFCGPSAYSAFSNFANSAANGYRITASENVFGMNINEIQTPYGTLSITLHPLFKEITAFAKHMVIADLSLLHQKVMEPLFIQPNIQANGADTYVEQFRAKYGLKLKFPGAFGYAYDLQKILA